MSIPAHSFALARKSIASKLKEIPKIPKNPSRVESLPDPSSISFQTLDFLDFLDFPRGFGTRALPNGKACTVGKMTYLARSSCISLPTLELVWKVVDFAWVFADVLTQSDMVTRQGTDI